MKKGMSITLVLCMLMSLFAAVPATVSAAVVDSGTCGENLTWTLDDAGTLTISGTGMMKAPHAWDGNANVKHVVIQSGVESIDTGAFCGCANLESVDIADSVWSMGDMVFALCEKLTEIKLPRELRAVGTRCFSGSGLKSVTFPGTIATIGDRAFTDCQNLESVTVEESDPNALFKNCTIQWNAFANCPNLKTVKLSKRVGVIEQFAFNACPNLTSVEMDGVAKLEQYAFYNASQLKNVSVGENLKEIGEKVFAGCTSLGNIYFGGDQAAWEKAGGAKASDVDLSGVIRYNTKTPNLEESKTNETEGSGVEESVNIPGETDVNASIVVAASDNLYPNLNREMLNLVNSDYMNLKLKYGTPTGTVYDSGTYYQFGESLFVAFYNVLYPQGEFVEPSPLACSVMAYCPANELILNLSKDVYTIQELSEHLGIYLKKTYNDMWGVYEACSEIEGTYLYFFLNEEGKIDVRQSVNLIAKWKDAFAPSTIGFSSIEKDVDLSNATKAGIFYYEDETIVKIDESATGTVVIPAKIGEQRITTVGNNAFLSNPNVTSVVFENGITHIREYAFYEMPNLKTVKMPRTLEYLGISAFQNCKALETATIPNGTLYVGRTAFSGCSSLIYAKIPVSVKTLGFGVYEKCDSLTAVAFLSQGENSDTMMGAAGAMFEGPVKYVVVGGNISMIPLSSFTDKEDKIEELLLLSNPIRGAWGNDFGSALRNPPKIYYTGDKSIFGKSGSISEKTLRLSLWNFDEIIDRFDPFEFEHWAYFVDEHYDVVSVAVNDKLLFMDQNPIIFDGRTLVPVRAIFEAMNMDVVWDETAHTITAVGNGNRVILEPFFTKATVNGERKELDVPALIINDRTLVPVRFIAESVGATVEWNSATQLVDIKYDFPLSQKICDLNEKNYQIIGDNGVMKNIEIQDMGDSYKLSFDYYNYLYIPMQITVKDENYKVVDTRVTSAVWESTGIIPEVEKTFDTAKYLTDVTSGKDDAEDYVIPYSSYSVNSYRDEDSIIVPKNGHVFISYPQYSIAENGMDAYNDAEKAFWACATLRAYSLYQSFTKVVVDTKGVETEVVEDINWSSLLPELSDVTNDIIPQNIVKYLSDTENMDKIIEDFSKDVAWTQVGASVLASVVDAVPEISKGVAKGYLEKLVQQGMEVAFPGIKKMINYVKYESDKSQFKCMLEQHKTVVRLSSEKPVLANVFTIDAR